MVTYGDRPGVTYSDVVAWIEDSIIDAQENAEDAREDGQITAATGYEWDAMILREIRARVATPDPARWGRCGKALDGGDRFCSLPHGHAGECVDEQAAT